MREYDEGSAEEGGGGDRFCVEFGELVAAGCRGDEGDRGAISEEVGLHAEVLRGLVCCWWRVTIGGHLRVELVGSWSVSPIELGLLIYSFHIDVRRWLSFMRG